MRATDGVDLSYLLPLSDRGFISIFQRAASGLRDLCGFFSCLRALFSWSLSAFWPVPSLFSLGLSDGSDFWVTHWRDSFRLL